METINSRPATTIPFRHGKTTRPRLAAHRTSCIAALVSLVLATSLSSQSGARRATNISALVAYPGKVANFSDALPGATNALLAQLEKNRGSLDTSTLAICALALEAVAGENAFAVRA